MADHTALVQLLHSQDVDDDTLCQTEADVKNKVVFFTTTCAIVHNTSCLIQNAYPLLQKTCPFVHNTSCLVQNAYPLLQKTCLFVQNTSCFVQNACVFLTKLMSSFTTLKQNLSIKLFR
ncbi:hypothetical protein [Nostoc sp. UHCC 0252]|uniref:hypothetical protein n=1 Tax=Nostoc sp. UHCC 0252 TaxID=3110241 RepID=UPI002B20A093|nr:hypothetical protein [Nostoc sp. UHCC 0252]MEA5604035.1 hypothetical protein [Nostoc sp. UHCC 0252]